MDFFRSGDMSNSQMVTSEGDSEGNEAFNVRLGDLMRGERATLGKSLLDVERELKIKAAYISAIENTDPNAFETPGFIAGYVRSYARYLGMNPDQTFERFCRESGFQTAHGMSAAASVKRNQNKQISSSAPADKYDAIFKPGTPFLPEEEGFLARIEPGALGSSVVLLALIAVIGYGAWSVLNEVQKVKVAPVENSPEVLSDLDPVTSRATAGEATDMDVANVDVDEQAERLDRLYRPEALDVPVMIARDGPISTLDPASVGTLPASSPSLATAAMVGTSYSNPTSDAAFGAADSQVLSSTGDAKLPPQVLEQPRPELRVVAVRPAWVQIRSADGLVIFEGVMNAGGEFDVPQTEEPATMKVGESGAVYFAMDNKMYGPAGPSGAVTSKVVLSTDEIGKSYSVAQLEDDKDLSSYLAKLDNPEQPTKPQE